MHSISAKVGFWLVALLVFLSSCSREGSEPLWEAQSVMGNEYKGGLFPVYITLKEPVDNANRIRWKTSYANIAYRKQGMNSKHQITADTAFLYWETPPPEFKEEETTKGKDSDGKDTDGKEPNAPTTKSYYRDTVFAVVNNVESLPMVIEIKNILPRIASITIGGVEKPGDSLLTIAANLGDKLTISLKLKREFENPFNKGFHPVVTMPAIMGNLTLKSTSKLDDGFDVFNYEWVVPNKEISDSSGYLKIEDSGGHGERLYKVHLIVYTECGSVWVAAENEIVKYSPKGTEVARIKQASTKDKDFFNSISDIVVNSKNGKLFVADEWKSIISIYNNYGGWLSIEDKSFSLPSGIVLDLDGNSVWIADAKVSISSAAASSSGSKSASSVSSSSISLSSSSVLSSASSSVYEARLRRFLLMSDKLNATSMVYEMDGPIKGLSINQFQSDFVWFTNPKSNKVGFTIKPPDPKFIEPKFALSSSSSSSTSFSSSSSSSVKAWNRPSMVSHDLNNGTTWIADSSRIVAIDTSGHILANITGFGFVSSVSASKGNVWASDQLSGKVYHFKGPFRGTNLTVMDAIPIDGFIAPVSVSAYIADGGAWVIDREAGMAVRLDSLGNKIASGTGLKQPILGKTLQKVE